MTLDWAMVPQMWHPKHKQENKKINWTSSKCKPWVLQGHKDFKRVRTQPRMGALANPMSDKGFLSRLQDYCCSLTERQTPRYRMSQGWRKRVLHKPMKRCSMSLGKCKSKPSSDPSLGWLSSKTQRTNLGEPGTLRYCWWEWKIVQPLWETA